MHSMSNVDRRWKSVTSVTPIMTKGVTFTFRAVSRPFYPKPLTISTSIRRIGGADVAGSTCSRQRIIPLIICKEVTHGTCQRTEISRQRIVLSAPVALCHISWAHQYRIRVLALDAVVSPFFFLSFLFSAALFRIAPSLALSPWPWLLPALCSLSFSAFEVSLSRAGRRIAH